MKNCTVCETFEDMNTRKIKIFSLYLLINSFVLFLPEITPPILRN